MLTRQSMVLVVDPVPMFRELGSVFLSRFGRVLTASSGEEALECVRRERPEVVVVDLHLPDLDGTLLCREVRTAPATAQTAVVVTGIRSAAEHARAIRAGASDVLAKPLSRITLVDSVGRLLGEPPRGLPRVDVRAPVRLSSADGVHWGTVRNLSRGGLFIESPWTPPDQREIALEFTLPDGTPRLAPTAMLIWQRGEFAGTGRQGPAASQACCGMGVRFVALGRQAALSLDTYVHERFVPQSESSTGEAAR